jgi:uncharacterized protein
MKNNLLFTDALKMNRPNAFHVMLKPAGAQCNLNCTYCYYLEKKKLYNDRSDLRMTEELLENFTKQYIEAQEIPVVTFTWQGGEPTLMGLDFFKKAIGLQKKYSAGKKIENAFQTNGTKLNDEWCSFFSDNNILVGISIDGAGHNHDYYRKTYSGGNTFGRVMKGIDLLQKHKVEFNTLSTINNYNVDFASETYRFLKSIGSRFMQFLPVVERIASDADNSGLRLASPAKEKAQVSDWSVGSKDFGNFMITIFNEWVRNDVGKYYVQLFDATLANYAGENPGLCVFNNTCGDALVMEHNGDFYSCDHYVYPEYFLGNITQTPIIDLVKLQRQFDFGIAKRNALPKYCLQCEVLFACQGECPKHRFLITPDGKPGLNYLCEGYKLFFIYTGLYLEFMAKELKNKRAPANVMTWIKNRENQAIKSRTPERNDPCPCGSGKKFKNCCMNKPLFLA